MRVAGAASFGRKQPTYASLKQVLRDMGIKGSSGRIIMSLAMHYEVGRQEGISERINRASGRVDKRNLTPITVDSLGLDDGPSTKINWEACEVFR